MFWKWRDIKLFGQKVIKFRDLKGILFWVKRGIKHCGQRGIKSWNLRWNRSCNQRRIKCWVLFDLWPEKLILVVWEELNKWAEGIKFWDQKWMNPTSQRGNKACKQLRVDLLVTAMKWKYHIPKNSQLESNHLMKLSVILRIFLDRNFLYF